MHPRPTRSPHRDCDPLSAQLRPPEWHLCKKAEAFDMPLVILTPHARAHSVAVRLNLRETSKLNVTRETWKQSTPVTAFTENEALRSFINTFFAVSSQTSHCTTAALTPRPREFQGGAAHNESRWSGSEPHGRALNQQVNLRTRTYRDPFKNNKLQVNRFVLFNP